MVSLVVASSSQSTPSPHRRSKGDGGNKLVVGAMVKGKVVEWEDDIRAVFIRQRMKYFIRLVSGAVDNKRNLERFEDGVEKDMISNQLTILKEERIPNTK